MVFASLRCSSGRPLSTPSVHHWFDAVVSGVSKAVELGDLRDVLLGLSKDLTGLYSVLSCSVCVFGELQCIFVILLWQGAHDPSIIDAPARKGVEMLSVNFQQD